MLRAKPMPQSGKTGRFLAYEKAFHLYCHAAPSGLVFRDGEGIANRISRIWMETLLASTLAPGAVFASDSMVARPASRGVSKNYSSHIKRFKPHRKGKM